MGRMGKSVEVSLTDESGSIYTWSGQSLKQDPKMQKRGASKKRSCRQSSSMNLNMCDMDTCELRFDLERSIQGTETRGRGAHQEMLHFRKIQGNKFMIVHQD